MSQLNIPGNIREGFRFQDYKVLHKLAQWLRDPEKYTAISVESNINESLNDFIAFRPDESLELYQFKHSADKNAKKKVWNLNDLIQCKGNEKTPLLKKWFDSYSLTLKTRQVHKIYVVTTRTPAKELLKLLSIDEYDNFAFDLKKLNEITTNKILDSLKTSKTTLKKFFNRLSFQFSSLSIEASWDATYRILIDDLGGAKEGLSNIADEVYKWSTEEAFASKKLTIEHIQEAAFIDVLTDERFHELCDIQVLEEIKKWYPDNIINEITALYQNRSIDIELVKFAFPFSFGDSPLFEELDFADISGLKRDFKHRRLREIKIKKDNMESSFNDIVNKYRNEYTYDESEESGTATFRESLNQLLRDLDDFFMLFKKKIGLVLDVSGIGKTWSLVNICINQRDYNKVFVSSKNYEFFNKSSVEESLRYIWNSIDPNLKLSSDRVKSMLTKHIKGEDFLIILIDAIDQGDELSIKNWLNEFSSLKSNKIKVILTCRDIYWSKFSQNVSEAFKNLSWENKVSSFTSKDLKKVFEKYSRHYQFQFKPEEYSIPNHILSSPLSIRFLFECIKDKSLLSKDFTFPALLEHHSANALKSLQKKLGMTQFDVTLYFQKLAELYWEKGKDHKTTHFYVSEAEFKAGLSKYPSDNVNMFINICRDRGILNIKEPDSSWTTDGYQISFVFQEYMEYMIAKFLISKIDNMDSEKKYSRILAQFPSIDRHPNSTGIKSFLLTILGIRTISDWFQSEQSLHQKQQIFRQIYLYSNNSMLNSMMVGVLIACHYRITDKKDFIKDLLVPKREGQQYLALRKQLSQKLEKELDLAIFKATYTGDSGKIIDFPFNDSIRYRSLFKNKLISIPEKLFGQSNTWLSFWLDYFPDNVIPSLSSNEVSPDSKKFIIENMLLIGSLDSIPIRTKYKYFESLHTTLPQLKKMSKHINVVVTDDDKMNLTIIKSMITETILEQCASYTFSLTDPVEEIKSGKVDILITDSMRPGLSGDELIQMLKDANPMSKTIRLSAGRGFQTSMNQEHYDIVMGKPFVESDLLEMLGGTIFSTQKYLTGLGDELTRMFKFHQKITFTN